MRSADFWNYFDRIARPNMTNRAEGFSKIFSYLDRFDRPVTIVETGCVRAKDAWEADGQSTVLFDKYCQFHPGSTLCSVDIDPEATALCRSLVGPHARVHTGDSIAFLRSLGNDPSAGIAVIDLLYLDSHDVNFRDPLPAALHALKELLAATPLLSAETLVVTDDSPQSFLGMVNSERGIRIIGSPQPGGKGTLIGEYAAQIGVRPLIAEYQCGWRGLGGRGPGLSPPPGERRADTAQARDREAVRPPMKMADLLSRMTDALPRSERLDLALRLLETEAEEITFRRAGIRWTAFLWDELISRLLFVEGGFQPLEIRAVVSWLGRHGRLAPPRDVIIDVGANIGTSTIPLARRTGCRVIAIEPAPEIFAVLRRNIGDNGLTEQVACVEAAIGMAKGRVRMILPERNSGGGEVVRPGIEASFAGSHAVRGMAEVSTMRLDEILEAQGIAPERVALVWSDTQGCEAEVIETGRALWAAGVPLFAEWDPRVLGGPEKKEALLCAVHACFSGFIPAQTLKIDADATPQPIAELAAFVSALGSDNTDILLLPESHAR